MSICLNYFQEFVIIKNSTHYTYSLFKCIFKIYAMKLEIKIVFCKKVSFIFPFIKYFHAISKFERWPFFHYISFCNTFNFEKLSQNLSKAKNISL